MKRLVKFIFVIVIVSVLTVTAFAYTGPAFVATNTLNVYDKGGWNCNVLDCLPRNTNVTIESDAGYGWYKISYNGKTGYVAGYYLLFGYSEEPVQQVNNNVETIENSNTYATDVNMRAGPSLKSDVLYCLPDTSTVNVHGICGDWYEVDYNGSVGYIYSTYINWNGSSVVNTQPLVEESKPEIVTQTATGVDIVNTALQYIGTPYVWGGTSPSGFDCSGLVYYVYKQHGITINRVAQDMYSNGREIPMKSLQPGDILLFGSSIYNIWHVGIYSGNGMVIHSSYGDVVRNQYISSLQGMHLVSARRLVDF